MGIGVRLRTSTLTRMQPLFLQPSRTPTRTSAATVPTALRTTVPPSPSGPDETTTDFKFPPKRWNKNRKMMLGMIKIMSQIDDCVSDHDSDFFIYIDGMFKKELSTIYRTTDFGSERNCQLFKSHLLTMIDFGTEGNCQLFKSSRWKRLTFVNSQSLGTIDPKQ